MKKFLLPIFLIVCCTGVNAQVNNGNFDSWNQIDLFDHPMMEVEVSSSNFETFFDAEVANVTAVDGASGTALRLESVAFGDQVYPAFFLTGTVPNGEGENLIFGGGLPVNDAGVTGIKLDIRHNIVEGSQGLLIVQFKNNGNPVGEGTMAPGTMILPIEGASDWHEKTIEFEGGFPVVPDACVVGVTTADLLTDDGSFPAGSFVEIDNIQFLNGITTVEGVDFESWEAEEPIFTPEGVLVDVDMFNPTFERTVDAVNGMFALQLTTRFFEDGQYSTGRAVFGEGDLWNPTPTVALHPNDNALSFAYKYAPTGNDLGSAQFTFFTNENEQWIPVHSKQFELEATEEYTWINYAFKEELTELGINATHVLLTFESSKWNEVPTAGDGSTLLIDDIALDGTLRFGTVLVATPRVTASPNPAVHRVTFDFNLPRSGFYRVLDSKGQQVAIREFQSSWNVTHDLQNLRSGMYLFRFTHNAGVDVVRVLKL